MYGTVTAVTESSTSDDGRRWLGQRLPRHWAGGPTEIAGHAGTLRAGSRACGQLSRLQPPDSKASHNELRQTAPIKDIQFHQQPLVSCRGHVRIFPALAAAFLSLALTSPHSFDVAVYRLVDTACYSTTTHPAGGYRAQEVSRPAEQLSTLPSMGQTQRIDGRRPLARQSAFS